MYTNNQLVQAIKDFGRLSKYSVVRSLTLTNAENLVKMKIKNSSCVTPPHGLRFDSHRC